MNGEESQELAAGSGLDEPARQVRIVVRDDLQRSRLTVFFRFFLAIPHLLVLGAWGLFSIVMAVINWFTILFTGRAVAADIQRPYLRYFTHVDAYLNLAANPFPAFGGEAPYPIDIEVPVVERQNRWKTAFRPGSRGSSRTHPRGRSSCWRITRASWSASRWRRRGGRAMAPRGPNVPAAGALCVS